MGKEFAQISGHLITSAGLRTEPATPRRLFYLLYPQDQTVNSWLELGC